MNIGVLSASFRGALNFVEAFKQLAEAAGF